MRSCYLKYIQSTMKYNPNSLKRQRSTDSIGMMLFFVYAGVFLGEVFADVSLSRRAFCADDFIESIGVVSNHGEPNDKIGPLGIRYIRTNFKGKESKIRTIKDLHSRYGIKACLLWSQLNADREPCRLDRFHVRDSTSGAVVTFEAEAYAKSSGSNLSVDRGVLSGMREATWIMYENVEFGDGGKMIDVRLSVADDHSGSWIGILIDGPWGKQAKWIGTVAGFPGTGGWNRFETKRIEPSKQGDPAEITGIHDLYFVFHPRPILDTNHIDPWLDKIADQLLDECAAIEGVNEYDMKKKGIPNWLSEVRAFHEILYKKVKAHLKLKNTPVIAPSFVGYKTIGGSGDWTAMCDRGNAHPYTCFHPSDKVDKVLNGIAPAYASKPVWATEIGYSTAIKQPYNPGGWAQVPITEELQAKYLLRMYACQFGIRPPGAGWFEKTFWFRINDGQEAGVLTSYEGNRGLVRADGTLKPACNSLKNMIDLLSDRGTSFTPGTLDFTLSGDTTDLMTMLLQKRDGRFYLVLWQEVFGNDPALYNKGRSYPEWMKTIKPRPVMVSIKKSVASAKLYYPLNSTEAKNDWADKKSFTFDVPDYLAILELSPDDKPVTIKKQVAPLPVAADVHARKPFVAEVYNCSGRLLGKRSTAHTRGGSTTAKHGNSFSLRSGTAVGIERHLHTGAQSPRKKIILNRR